MKFFTKEVKIALVAIVAIVVLFVGMQFLKGMSVFSSNDVVYVSFNDITGLSASSPVYANGYRVGVVQSIDYDYEHPDHIVAAVDLDPKLRLTEGSCAEIVSDFLGNVRLELRFGPAGGKAIAAGDTIPGAMQEGLMSKAASMIPQVEQMLPRLDSILACVNALVADPALAGTVHNTQALTASLAATAQQLSVLSAQLGHQVPGMMGKAEGVLTNAETLTGNLAKIDLDATMQQVDATLANLQRLSASLSDADGTLGLLMNDPELYRNLNATMRDADSLLVDFRLHPKRYINVSVFGKKEK